MFEASEGLTPAQAVEKLKAKRATDSQPEQPVTSEEPEDVSVDETEPEAETQDEVEESEELETAESEPLESGDDESELYYDLDGEEVTASQIKAWKDGHLMQSDYTRKTQAHADEVKQFKQQQEEFSNKAKQLESRLAELDVILKEDTPDAETIQEWREYEPEKYIEYKEKKEKREKLLSESKHLTNDQKTNFQTEYTKFAQDIGGVTQDGKATQEFEQNVALMTKYAESNGLTHDDITGFKSGHFKLLLDAAKFNESKTKNAAITKKVRKAPVSTKPKAAAKTGLMSEIEQAQKRFKQTGKPEDAVKLRRLQRQL
jgi:hypothetical protein